MRGLVQRVRNARVSADGAVVGQIERGLLVYLGVGTDDTVQYAERLAEKIASLRIFEDQQGRLNRSVRDIRGDVLAVSNFTLLADARKGRRPAFLAAAPAEEAQPLYEAFTAALEREGCRVACGAFGRHMDISSVADGPVNVIVDYPSPPDGCEKGVSEQTTS